VTVVIERNRISLLVTKPEHLKWCTTYQTKELKTCYHVVRRYTKTNSL